MGSRDLERRGIRAACGIFGTGCVGIAWRYQSCGGIPAKKFGPQTFSGPQRCTFLRQRILSRDLLGESRECNQPFLSKPPSKPPKQRPPRTRRELEQKQLGLWNLVSIGRVDAALIVPPDLRGGIKLDRATNKLINLPSRTT